MAMLFWVLFLALLFSFFAGLVIMEVTKTPRKAVEAYPLGLSEVISLDGFDYQRWRESEEQIIRPQLAFLGYRDIRFGPGETDSFGPLTRMVFAIDPDGERVEFVYG